METNSKYNGWTNYETWRIALEIFDGNDDLIQELSSQCTDVYDLRDSMQEYVNEQLDEQPDSIFKGHAEAFISNVNWYEIAEHYTELLFNIDEK